MCVLSAKQFVSHQSGQTKMYKIIHMHIFFDIMYAFVFILFVSHQSGQTREINVYTYNIYDHLMHVLCFYSLLVTKVDKLKCIKLFTCTKFYDIMCAFVFIQFVSHQSGQTSMVKKSMHS